MPTSTHLVDPRPPDSDQPLVYYPPESAAGGHFWVLVCIHAGGRGFWRCRDCGLESGSEKVTGFLVAAPHWSDVKGPSCEERVVDQVHDL